MKVGKDCAWVSSLCGGPGVGPVLSGVFGQMEKQIQGWGYGKAFGETANRPWVTCEGNRQMAFTNRRQRSIKNVN